MIDILSYCPGKRKITSSGWISFNAVCCIHNGQSQDRRQRGGMKIGDQGWSYHCFNCNFTASFIMGRNLGVKARKLLQWLHVPEEEINRVNLESMRHRSIEGILHDRQRIYSQLADISFPEVDLPIHADFLTDTESDEYKYLVDRAVPMDYPYMTVWNGDAWKRHHTRPGVLIPFTHEGNIVGSTIRFLDNRAPKFLNEMPNGYVFGTDLQQTNWQYVVVCEGVFDALSISGLALLHSEISDSQARLIRSLSKEVIVVPDQDRSGMELVDRSIELGWSVSMPNWPQDVKDVNDAVRRFGRVGTLLTIIQAQETSRVKIELRKKQLLKRFK